MHGFYAYTLSDSFDLEGGIGDTHEEFNMQIFNKSDYVHKLVPIQMQFTVSNHLYVFTVMR